MRRLKTPDTKPGHHASSNEYSFLGPVTTSQNLLLRFYHYLKIYIYFQHAAIDIGYKPDLLNE